MDVGGQLPALAGEGSEFALDLEAVPEVVGLAEEDAEANRHGGRDGAAAQHDFIDGTGRDANGTGHGILGNAHGLEIFLQEDFARGDRWIHGYNV